MTTIGECLTKYKNPYLCVVNDDNKALHYEEILDLEDKDYKSIKISFVYHHNDKTMLVAKLSKNKNSDYLRGCVRW